MEWSLSQNVDAMNSTNDANRSWIFCFCYTVAAHKPEMLSASSES